MDKRILKTRKLLLQALIELIQEKGYDAVTITDISERALIGRSTFYAHFENKEQLLFSGQDAFPQNLLRHQQGSGSGNSLLFYQELFEHMQSNRHLAKAMLGEGGGDLMLGRLHSILEHRFLEQAKSKIVDKTRQELQAHAFASAMVGLSSKWLEQVKSLDSEEMAKHGRQMENVLLKMLSAPIPLRQR